MLFVWQIPKAVYLLQSTERTVVYRLQVSVTFVFAKLCLGYCLWTGVYTIEET